MSVETITATEFKAKCLDILDRVNRREVEKVVITKRGIIVAELVAPAVTEADMLGLHGFMRGSVDLPDDLDLTEPMCDEPFLAASGILHS